MYYILGRLIRICGHSTARHRKIVADPLPTVRAHHHSRPSTGDRRRFERARASARDSERRRRRTCAPARRRALPACPIHVLLSGYVPCTLPRRGPTPYDRSAASLQAAVEGGRWRASGGDGDERASAGQKTSAERAPETSCGCPGACARAVGAAVVANEGREWREGAGQDGRLGTEVEPSKCPTLPLHHDSAESIAGGASETLGMESATQKTVSHQFLRCSDAGNLPGASPRPFVPKRSSTLLGRDSQTDIYLRPVSYKAVWLRLKVRTPVFEGVEHEYDFTFAS